MQPGNNPWVQAAQQLGPMVSIEQQRAQEAQAQMQAAAAAQQEQYRRMQIAYVFDKLLWEFWNALRPYGFPPAPRQYKAGDVGVDESIQSGVFSIVFSVNEDYLSVDANGSWWIYRSWLDSSFDCRYDTHIGYEGKHGLNLYSLALDDPIRANALSCSEGWMSYYPFMAKCLTSYLVINGIPLPQPS